MDNKEKIKELYFEVHLKTKEIADILHISSPYITKIVKQDSRYIDEKEKRKEESKQKRKIEQKLFMKNKREMQRIEDNYNSVKVQHEQASRELSKGKHLSNESYRKWNYSAYKYNPLKNRYEFDENLGRSYAVPKYIKGKSF